MNAPHRTKRYDDASMSDGETFLIFRRATRLFGLLDQAPPRSSTVTPDRLAARRNWPEGERARQVSWDQHGKVQILRLRNGTEIAVWWEETVAG